MGKMKDSWRFAVMLALLVSGGVIIHVWERAGEASVARRSLSEMPTEVGSWHQIGADQRFDAQTESVLRADDYLARSYQRADGRAASFYVGYYATQRTGATYHSPLNCLPGSGWEMNEPGSVTITPADGSAPFEANRYIIQNGDDRQLLIYWYQGRGRKMASEYWGKIYTVIDSIRRRRSDGAMVRVMMPLGKSESETLSAATDLAAQIAPVLPAFVPD
ncbi:MAG TPA: EpsI family protein [Pyrinomonadaceae bacterium]|nr:EpsI family protein [Pyrinomonadaceae bacterium]